MGMVEEGGGLAEASDEDEEILKAYKLRRKFSKKVGLSWAFCWFEFKDYVLACSVAAAVVVVAWPSWPEIPSC